MVFFRGWYNPRSGESLNGTDNALAIIFAIPVLGMGAYYTGPGVDILSCSYDFSRENVLRQ